jgi:hypothetical protein
MANADVERIIEFMLETSPESAMQTLVNIRSAAGILEAHLPSVRDLTLKWIRIRYRCWQSHTACDDRGFVLGGRRPG